VPVLVFCTIVLYLSACAQCVRLLSACVNQFLPFLAVFYDACSYYVTQLMLKKLNTSLFSVRAQRVLLVDVSSPHTHTHTQSQRSCARSLLFHRRCGPDFSSSTCPLIVATIDLSHGVHSTLGSECCARSFCRKGMDRCRSQGAHTRTPRM
jgi:hypothetical protein